MHKLLPIYDRTNNTKYKYLLNIILIVFKLPLSLINKYNHKYQYSLLAVYYNTTEMTGSK